MQKISKYIIIGALAGGVNGTLGAGGGLILVPLLTKWTALEEKQAFPTSVAIIFLLSILSAGVYLKNDAVDWRFAGSFLWGGAVGGSVAGRIFRKIPLLVLRRSFGIFILYGAMRALL